MSFMKKIKSNIYFKKLKNNKIEIKDINEEFLTSEICMYEIKRHINYFRIMPKKLINTEICMYIFNTCIDYFEFIPEEYKTKEMCEKVINISYENIKYIPIKYRSVDMYYGVINNISNYTDLISLNEIPEHLKQLYVDKAIIMNPSYILEVDNNYIMEYNWIEAINLKDDLVFNLPDKYKNKSFFKKMVELKPIFISKMPLNQLSQELFDLAFEKDPNLIKYFPDQFITKSMVDYIKLYLPQYNKRIPLRYKN